MTKTRRKILEASKAEFLEKGFMEASLRTIAGNAGMTTGAIYGLYTDKHGLFRELVEPQATEFRNRFLKEQQDFADLERDVQIAVMNKHSTDALQELLDYIYQNFDAFRLLICCASGTQYENFIHELVEVESQSTIAFHEVLQQAGYHPPPISENLVHILSSAYFTAIFETVAHGMDKGEADDYVAHITDFFKAGWNKLFDLPQE